jgi:hypothetical protein
MISFLLSLPLVASFSKLLNVVPLNFPWQKQASSQKIADKLLDLFFAQRRIILVPVRG